MRVLTAGESHGQYEVGIIEGFPKGLRVDQAFIDRELKRRMSGYGRGARMALEIDEVHIVSGVRDKVTLGSPVAMLVRNRDVRIFAAKNDKQEQLVVPRPAHADLAGALKYADKDIRNILERSSARETVARVAIGALCKQFLAELGVHISSFTLSVGSAAVSRIPSSIAAILSAAKKSQLNCPDPKAELRMIDEIDKASKARDSLGGVCEVRAEGICPGIGSCMHFDKRLDSRIAGNLMSIPAIKGVEIGLGFEYAAKRGSAAHDKIYYARGQGFFHKTNRSGGIEGGMSTGEPIVARIAMKPIATLLRPLDSVNLTTHKKAKAVVERSDTCAIVACGVIAESMVAIALTESYLEKFGCDSLGEIKANYRNYLKSLK